LVEKESDYQSVFADVTDDLGHPAPAKFNINAKQQMLDEKVCQKEAKESTVLCQCTNDVNQTISVNFIKVSLSL